MLRFLLPSSPPILCEEMEREATTLHRVCPSTALDTDNIPGASGPFGVAANAVDDGSDESGDESTATGKWRGDPLLPFTLRRTMERSGSLLPVLTKDAVGAYAGGPAEATSINAEFNNATAVP